MINTEAREQLDPHQTIVQKLMYYDYYKDSHTNTPKYTNSLANRNAMPIKCSYND